MLKLFLTIVLFQFISSACEYISAPSNINVSVSHENKQTIFYNNEFISENNPTIKATNCHRLVTKKKYLMISLGLENFLLTDQFMSYSINDLITYNSNDYCKIENSPIQKDTTKSYRHERLKQRRKVLNKCISIKITDKSEKGLDIPLRQPGCAVKKIDKNTASIYGYYCFVKPHIDSSISYEVNVNKQCENDNYYKSQKMYQSDILGLVQIYSTGDASGTSGDLESLKSIKFRYSTNPNSNLINTTINDRYKDPRIPVWPSTWSVNNLNLSKPIFNSYINNTANLFVPIFASNQCKRTCNDGLCTSPCDYTQPLAAEFVLYELLEDGKKEYLSSWYDGGIIPAQWTGLVTGTGKNLSKKFFSERRKYQIKANFNDQEFNYLMYKGKIKNILKLRPTSIPDMPQNGGSLPDIPSFGKATSYQPLPDYPEFKEINFTGGNHTTVMSTINSISYFFNSYIWPPYVNDYCFENSCVLKKNHDYNITLNFEIKYDENEDIEVTNLKQTVSRGQSVNVINNYIPPAVDCTNPNDDYNDDDDDDLGDIDF
ncbi:hypothetical protein [Halobacteriovorax sp. DPLXC-1]|uniref:hypothetical protein n=1 Tax=Halobacteriovorax sp. DPLXC-1 TaxID=3110771 RepID=UPI002FF1D1C8